MYVKPGGTQSNRLRKINKPLFYGICLATHEFYFRNCKPTRAVPSNYR